MFFSRILQFNKLLLKEKKFQEPHRYKPTIYRPFFSTVHLFTHTENNAKHFITNTPVFQRQMQVWLSFETRTAEGKAQKLHLGFMLIMLEPKHQSILMIVSYRIELSE